MPLAPDPNVGKPRTAAWFKDRGIDPDHITGIEAMWAGGQEPVVTWGSRMTVSPDDLAALAEAMDADESDWGRRT